MSLVSGESAATLLQHLANAAIWGGYIALFIFLARRGKGHDAALSGKVGFSVQAFAYVATYISTVALVGFGGLAYTYGLQMLLVAAGNVWLGTWAVYRCLAWPTKLWRAKLGVRSPAMLIGIGHHSPLLGRIMAFIFAVFLGVYASAVIKGAALMLAEAIGLPLWALIWCMAVLVGISVSVGGLRGVLYTEAMQGVIMLAGIVMIVAAVIVKAGGPVNGLAALAALPPTPFADNGFTSLSGGGKGLFILSLAVVTSVAVWAQPQMIQRHFAIDSRSQLSRITPLAMLVLTVLVGGAYFAMALARVFLPENAPGIDGPDTVMPTLVRMLLPDAGMHLFILAVVSASLSTATALFHIATLAFAEDVPAQTATRRSWRAGVFLCILVSAGCAQIKGSLIAMLCTTSWSLVGSMALVPYVALVGFGRRDTRAAWAAALGGFAVCLLWYLAVYGQSAVFPAADVLPGGHILCEIPPFFAGLASSLAGWLLFAGKKTPAIFR